MIRVSKNGACTTLQEARDRCLDIGESEGRRVLVIRVEDNGVYGGNFDIDLPPETAVTIEAGEGCRPTWRPVGNNVIRGAEGSSFSLDGFLVEGGLQIAGSPDIRITHTTLVPGWSLNQDGSPRYPRANSLQTSDASDRPGVTIHRSICGPLRIPADARPLTVSESILDAPPEDGSYPAVAGWESGEGPKAVMERCTVFGQVCVAELEASDSIFLIDVTVERRQAGCIRFSYVPGASRTPRRYRCQPDLSLEAARTAGDRTEQQIAALEAARRPAFTRRRYGRPGYAQLSAACSPDILTGAQNGSEMGAFNRLFQADRESNLRRVIDEYIRFGFEAGIFYVS
ncbi:hypothetical protein ASZ90_008909 [hydrocarbon metagenome]|uniref:Uncharacterized protein n=1 Tax=hydrocarbon metagenome TaxID=938273 RepID=A0A0W8FKD5_9ZZZZ